MFSDPKIFRIGLYFDGLHSKIPGSGQYRYLVDLVRGLSQLNPNNVQFILFGSKAEPEAELEDLFASQNTSWVYKRIKPWEFKGSYYLNQLRYAALLYFYRIDIWHILRGPTPLLAPCPVVKTVYDLMYELFDDYSKAVNSRLYKIEKWITINLKYHLIAISQTTAEDLEKRWGLPKNKISVVHLGVNFSRIADASANLVAVNLINCFRESILLSPFNLEPRKNLDSLLLALPAVIKKYPNIRLILFGRASCTPEREQKFKNLVDELGIEKNIICTGFIDDADLVALYRHATVFVFPSLYEGFGLPVLEAMSMGACVIAKKASAMAEVVGEAGALVETCDHNNLAEALLMLLDDELMRKQLGEAARQRAKEFSIENMVLKTWSVYEEISSKLVERQ